MASLVVLLIVLGSGALQFFKGTFVKALAAVIIAVIAGMVSFGFFEAAANMIISRSDSGWYLSIAPWAQTLCFLLIFVVVFALLQTGAMYLLREPVDFGELPEYIGRAVCGLLLGYLVSGFILVAFAMGPLSLDYPYPRFNVRNLRPDDPKGVLLNPDGFATGLFSMISKGSFSGKRSFAAIHPNYLDQLFFNRLIRTDTMSLISTRFPAIMVPRQAAVWPAPKNIKVKVGDKYSPLVDQLGSGAGKLKDDQGKSVPLPVSTEGNYDLTIVRVGIFKNAIRRDARINGGAFTPSQLRLICKRRGSGQDRLAGEGVNVYPMGHLRTADQIQVCSEIKLDSRNIDGNEQLIDFVFCVPSGHEPVLVQYKMNTIVEIPPSAIVTDSTTYEPVTFNASSGGGAGQN
ncbi:MAG: hypothetical protein ACYTE3_25995 [Planctomycetota bacterium]|jgi:hypothetical protein